MPRKTKTSKMNRLLRQTTDIALLSPTIASRRLMKLSSQTPWTAAFNLTAMGAEKFSAFTAAWIGMTTTAARAQTQLMLQTFGTLGKPARRGVGAMDTGLDTLAAGMGPVHRRVVGNASRR